MQRIESNFTSHGLKCSGLLLLPGGIARPPIVIMAHGFGAEKSFRLQPFAEKFVENGLAVFLFDYRNFGESEGEPRNLISPSRHLQDWQKALEHIRSLNEIDRSKIILWGTSFSGGHALVTAAEDPDVFCVTVQMPFVDGMASAGNFDRGIWLKSLGHALVDVPSWLLGTRPHYVNIVGENGRFCVLNTHDAEIGYLPLIPPDTKWLNRCPARIFFTLLLYRPVNQVSRIGRPVLIIYAEHDSLIPAAAVEATARRIKDVTLIKMPIGHFDAYQGEPLDRIAEAEIAFIRKLL